MAYDVSSFTDFIQRDNQILTKTLFAGGDSAKFAMFMAGVKGSTTIPLISGNAQIQSGLCPTPSGSTAAELVTLAVSAWTVYEEFCQDDLETKFPNTILAPGSYNAEDGLVPWEEELVSTKLASIAEQLELTYWQGDTAGTYSTFDGFIKQIDAAVGVVDGNTGSVSGSITQANVKAVVDAVRAAAPTKVKRDSSFVILVGDDVFDTYIAKEKADNLYHYIPEHDNGVYKIGGSGATLIRTYGLDGTSRIFASVGRNFIIGSDVLNEDQIADVFYDRTDDKVYLRVKAKSGVTISNPEEIVEFTLGV